MTEQVPSPALCAAGSLALGEPLYASVSPARYWLMLEVDEPWGAKAFPQSSLPEAVKAHLDAQLKALAQVDSLGSSRLLLIRQQPRVVKGGLRLFLADARPLAPALYEFSLPDYTALLSLDLAALAADPARLESSRREAPLFLVCTNGRRDPCCAANGLPAYRALAERYPTDAWQTSHVGGHRFAANLVCLPHALFYGRVNPAVALDLAQAYQHGQTDLEFYRGRGSLPEVAQAAEFFLRQELGLRTLDGMVLLDSTPVGEQEWRVRFLLEPEGRTHTVRLSVDQAGYRLQTSCKDLEPSDVPAYHLLGLE